MLVLVLQTLQPEDENLQHHTSLLLTSNASVAVGVLKYNYSARDEQNFCHTQIPLLLWVKFSFDIELLLPPTLPPFDYFWYYLPERWEGGNSFAPFFFLFYS